MNSIIIDVDGTICPIKKEHEEYIDLVPYQEMIDKLRELQDNGFKIVLFTSRNMRTFNNDIDMILKYTKPVLEKWLKIWDIPYDDIIFGKPWAGKNGLYVDDKTIRPKELLKYSLEEIEEICNKDRL